MSGSRNQLDGLDFITALAAGIFSCPSRSFAGGTMPGTNGPCLRFTTMHSVLSSCDRYEVLGLLIFRVVEGVFLEMFTKISVLYGV